MEYDDGMLMNLVTDSRRRFHWVPALQRVGMDGLAFRGPGQNAPDVKIWRSDHPPVVVPYAGEGCPKAGSTPVLLERCVDDGRRPNHAIHFFHMK
jgi:hypothetical protein